MHAKTTETMRRESRRIILIELHPSLLTRHNIYFILKTQLSRDNLIRVSELVSDLCPRVIYYSAVARQSFSRESIGGGERGGGPPCTNVAAVARSVETVKEIIFNMNY